MKTNNHFIYLFAIVLSIVTLSVLSSCSSTSAIPDGEQLFTGLKPIKYSNYEPSGYADSTQIEMEYALATIPNGALFGSSYHRTPFPISLWIWNAFSKSEGGVGKWMTKAFGSKPKLMSQVNPKLRAMVAESQLRKFGYFNGKVGYDIITASNPKKAKVAYQVDMGHLWTLDSISYVNFPPIADSLITVHKDEALVHKGDPFSVPNLDLERQRLTRLFRNNGYYFYNNSYASYLADTVNVPGKASLRIQMMDSLDYQSRHKWYLGHIDINFRRQFMQQLTDSMAHRHFTVHYTGKRPPVRSGAILRALKLRSSQLYSVDKEEESRKNIQNIGLFSYFTMRFTPRDTTEMCDTLDLALDCVFDKPYDFYVEANAKGKTSGHVGPELVLGLTKRNAFRGNEKLDINLHGSYEWQTGHNAEGSASGINTYEYGGDVSLLIPRLLTPWSLFSKRQTTTRDGKRRRRHQYYSFPTTTIKASSNVLNRPKYFKRHVVSGEITYDMWTSERSHHSFSPLVLSYEYMQNQTQAFKDIIANNPYLRISMQDQFVPKTSYTYQRISPPTFANPTTWTTTVSEGGNLVALGYLAAGRKWSEQGKKMFKNPFAQFAKVETDFVKLWRLSTSSSVVAHVAGGVVYSFGNSIQAPYYEQFYVGGANSIRAFNVRSIGPGKYKPKNSKMSYIEQTGDVKFLANLEYRPRLWGDLYGALFLDAGNVWTLRDDDNREGCKFEAKNFLKQMAVGTGVGLRYDMGLFVIRVDWGIGLHVPYESGKSGFFNMPSFKDAQSIHLAIGYPF